MRDEKMDDQLVDVWVGLMVVAMDEKMDDSMAAHLAGC